MKYLVLVTIFLLILADNLSAQIVPGCFTVVNSAGQPQDTFCLGERIYVLNCHPNAAATTVYDFGAGQGLGSDTSYLYTAAGSYTIRQDGTPTVGPSYQLIVPNAVTILSFPPPSFQVYACINNKVFVEITDTNYGNYQVDFGDGSNPVALTSGATTEHAYNPGGTFTITVTGTHAASGCTSSATYLVTTITQLPTPVLESVEVLNNPALNGSVKLLTQVTNGLRYKVLYRPVSSANYIVLDTFLATSTGSFSYTVSSVNNTQQGCYRMQVADYCPSSVLPQSNEICSVTLSVTAQNQQNLVSWQSYASTHSGLQNYKLYRNGTVIGTFSSGQTSYTDTKISCGRQYCYKVEGTITTGGITTSNTGCVTAQSNAAPGKAALHASFTLQNTVEVTLYKPATASFSRFFPQRSVNGGPFENMNSNSVPVVLDWDTSAAISSYCYQGTYRDSCQNISPITNIACPVILKGEILQGPGIASQVQLSWSAYVGYRNGVRRYSLEILNPQFEVIRTMPLTQALSYTDLDVPNDHEILLYRLKADPINNSEPEVYSNFVKFKQEFAVNIPSAFTPNGDNLNDVFEVKGNFFSEFDLTIISRTGQVVFQSNSKQRGWDGMVNGKPAAQDAYVFQFRGTAFSGTLIEKIGTVTLLR